MQLIIIIAKDCTLFYFKMLFLASACSGILISDGLDPCIMILCGGEPLLDNFVKLENLHFFTFWSAMRCTHAAPGC